MIQREFRKLCQQTLQGPDGRYSSAKVILMIGFFIVSILMWKLLLTGALTLDYFISYLAFLTGHNNLSKFLDSRNKSRDHE